VCAGLQTIQMTFIPRKIRPSSFLFVDLIILCEHFLSSLSIPLLV
jgi:hypothetical protein